MPISRRYQCSECLHEFPFLHMTRDEPPPSECPKCGASTGDEPIELPAFINIRSSKFKGREAAYRGFEAESEVRAEMAAEHLGVDKSEMSHLKITDMRDGIHEGDITAKTPTVNNDVTRRMAEINSRSPGTVGFTNPMGGVQGTPSPVAMVQNDKGMVSTPGPTKPYSNNTGAGINEGHMARASQLIRANNQGRYVEPK